MVAKSRSINSQKPALKVKKSEQSSAKPPSTSDKSAGSRKAGSEQLQLRSKLKKLAVKAAGTEARPTSFKQEDWYKAAWARISVSQSRSHNREDVSPLSLGRFPRPKDK